MINGNRGIIEDVALTLSSVGGGRIFKVEPHRISMGHRAQPAQGCSEWRLDSKVQVASSSK